jgi:hypothetical protein
MKKAFLLDYLKNEYSFDCNLNFLFEDITISELVSEIIDWIVNSKHDYVETLTFARDFHLGSDLSKNTKKEYYEELKKQHFFKVLENNLHCTDLEKISYTIYTIGKFSDNKNSFILENAYENSFKDKNLILSYRCLSELDWLESKKNLLYIEDLKIENSIYSNFILLYLFDMYNNEKEINKILLKSEFKHIFQSNLFTENDLYLNLMDLETKYNKAYSFSWSKKDIENFILSFYK